MGNLLKFIIFLPVRLVAAVVLAAFILLFGWITWFPLLPENFCFSSNQWYRDVRGKLISSLSLE